MSDSPAEAPIHGDAEFDAHDGLRLYRQWWLPADVPRGAVMLLHGLGEHSARYAHLAAALARAGWAVHALDHRGHGRSDGRRAFVRDYAEFMADIEVFRNIVEHRHRGLPLVVFGHSMGGNLALGHVLDHQAGVAGLALSGPALKPGESLSRAKLRAAKLLARYAPKLRPEALDASAISRDPAVVARYRNDPLVFTGKMSAGVAGALVGAMERFPARYGELRLPVLIQHGTADRLTNVAGSHELEARAVNATVTSHYYDGLYHEIFNEPEQDRVIGDLLAWLDALGGPAERAVASPA
jgi:acylglycerol lipase